MGNSDLAQTSKMQKARLRDVSANTHFTVKLHTEVSNTISWRDCVRADNYVPLRRRYALYSSCTKPQNFCFRWVQLQSLSATPCSLQNVNNAVLYSCVAAVAACGRGTSTYSCVSSAKQCAADTGQKLHHAPRCRR